MSTDKRASSTDVAPEPSKTSLPDTKSASTDVAPGPSQLSLPDMKSASNVPSTSSTPPPSTVQDLM